PGRAIGAIDIHDTYSFVDVPTEMHEQVIDAVNAASIKGRPVNVEVAGDQGGGKPRGPRGGGFRGGNRGGNNRGPRRDFDGGRRSGNRGGGGFNRGPRRDRY